MWYDSYVLNEVVLNIIGNFIWLDKSSVSVWVDDEAGKKPDIKTVRVFEKIIVDYRVSVQIITLFYLIICTLIFFNLILATVAT